MLIVLISGIRETTLGQRISKKNVLTNFKAGNKKTVKKKSLTVKHRLL
jgi:hypothetical protein